VNASAHFLYSSLRQDFDGTCRFASHVHIRLLQSLPSTSTYPRPGSVTNRYSEATTNQEIFCDKYADRHHGRRYD